MTAGRTPSRVRSAAAFFLVFFPAVYLVSLGSGALIEPDEARYGEIPREMIESGDFLTPRLNYVKYFEKPPLYYWLTGASLALLGRNEYAVRLPTAVMALAGIALTGLLARRFFGPRAGLLAAVVLGSAGGYLAMGQLAVIDMTLTFFLSTGTALLMLAALGEERGWDRGAALFL
nr:glycosyltransferase family 39 protein [bacterium]